MSRYAIWIAAIAVFACGRTDHTNDSTGATRNVEPAKSKANAKLVLVVVLDQLPSSALLLYAPYLPKDGAIHRAIENGMYQERVHYDYAGTNTAPGHASIFTGELPADHGIDSNDMYSYEVQSRIKIVDDQKSATFGVEGAFASPFRLVKPTVGDSLQKLSPASKVVSVSLKARAAVVSAGQTPDFVAWYDSRIPGFTTSTRYADSIPTWLRDWNQANPVSERIARWEAGDAATYEKLLGPDDVVGERQWWGLSRTFPHETTLAKTPAKAFMATPQSVDYLLDMTRQLAQQYELGKDEHPDLLSVSISSTDYTAHSFGTHSWEYMDVLLKTDKALGLLVDELSQNGEIAVLITSDHGGTTLPETTISRGLPGGRMGAEEMVTELEALADAEFGEGDWIQTFIQPYLYLTTAALKSDKNEQLVALIQRYAESSKEIEGIYPPAKARTWRGAPDPIHQYVANTVAPWRVALYVVPARGYVAMSNRQETGTGHGSPWIDDREVPLLAFGPGVSKHHGKDVVPQNRVASTIASLLGIDWHLPAKALPGSPAN